MSILYPASAFRTPFSVLITPFPLNIFPSIKAPKVSNNIPRNVTSCLLYFMFYRPTNSISWYSESCSDFMILVIPSISSFELTKMIPLPAITTPLSHIFLWIAPTIAKAEVDSGLVKLVVMT